MRSSARVCTFSAFIIIIMFCIYSYTDLNAEVDSMTARPDTDGSSDVSSVLVIVVPVSAAGALLVITISVVLIVFLKRHSKLFCQASLINGQRRSEISNGFL